MAHIIFSHTTISFRVEVVHWRTSQLNVGGNVNGFGIGVIHQRAVMVSEQLARAQSASVINGISQWRSLQSKSKAMICRGKGLDAIWKHAVRESVDAAVKRQFQA